MDDFYAARGRTIPPLPWPNFAPPLSTVYSVREEGHDPSAFIVSANITDFPGETYDCEYCTRPVIENDPLSMNGLFQQWLADHPDFPITPYTPPPEPTIEEIRAAMPPVTSRQLRLTLVRNGYSLSAIDAAIQALPEGPAKDEAQIEWEYATQFERLAPTLLTIAAALSISAEDIDTMWQQALAA